MTNIEYIDLHKGQWLSDLFDEIPSNKIIHKVLTGIGATYSEITNRLRNSIIIVPNIPVINGKVKFHKNAKDPIIIRSVTGNVRKETIINYLRNDEIKVKKFMTTPESFHVIIEAMELLGINVYNDYFLLIDECDKMILDSHYRDRISDPMDTFFRFKNKSIISATTIIPRDERFIKNGFQILELRPQFNFTQSIELLVTNNTVESFKTKYKEIKKSKDGGQIFVFFDSLQGILRLIDKAKIEANYSIFCSDKSKSKLKSDAPHLSNTYSNITEDKLSRINFITSRFYTAVDIFVRKPPHVLVISDAVFLPHTMVSAKTDVVQIKGRFRNTALASLTCISNHTNKNEYYTKVEAERYLELNGYAYNQIADMKRLSAFENDKSIISNVLENVPYNKFMKDEFVENPYMKDNFLHKNELIQTYTSCNNWINSFMPHFTGHKYFIPTIRTLYFDHLTGYGQNSKTKKYKDIALEVINQLKKANESDIQLMKDELLEDIKQEHPEIVEGFELFDEYTLNKYITSKKRLLKEILLYKQNNGIKHNYDILTEVKLTFDTKTFYPEESLKFYANYFIDKYNLEFSKDYYMKFLKKLLKFSNRTEKSILGIPTKGYYVREVII